jgi:KTSC domain
MEFEPTCSFSIRNFSYDETSGELSVHYFDGRRKVCSQVPASVAAALRDSTNPESLLQPYVATDCIEE